MPVEYVTENIFIREIDGHRYYTARLKNAKGVQLHRSLGAVDKTTLREAKLKLQEHLINIDETDPKPRPRTQKSPTFEEILPDALKSIALVKMWKNDRSLHQWEQSLYDHVVPTLGDRCLHTITVNDIYETLKPIWFTKTETAYRVRMRIEAIFAWAIVKKYIPGPNPAVWRNNLSLLLPSREKVGEHKHFEAPTLEEVRQIVQHCLSHPSPVSAALLFLIATVTRTTECIKASRAEISNDRWMIPQERMKTKQDIPHVVPLSKLAKKALEMSSKEGFLFQYKDSVINANSPRLKIINILNRKCTAHGIRSTFRDWCAREEISHAVAEKCLAHRVENKTVRAYLRDDLFELRREVLEMWADAVMVKPEPQSTEKKIS